ncbi:hypothetical protein DBV15_09351 [Temnothorax longispinosus]|uniref:Uncharacterized protein n=1 Tax=Temnothorax longispinosus TaxID=300112 RepID=A0A4S2L5I0_9HYME|nr:hypothetical protein DBV15_09351 [Temnothorax longispinosus]
MLSCAGLSAGVEPGEGEVLNGEANESGSQGWRQAKNSPTLGQLTLIFHPRHPSRPPLSPPPSSILCFCLLSTPRAHAVTRSHATNTCSCLPLRSYGRSGRSSGSTSRNGRFTDTSAAGDISLLNYNG